MDDASNRNCPICGQSNACEGSLACWCGKESFPRGLLELVPDEFRNRACICRACLVRFIEQSEHGDRTGRD
ncbi:cysteine-rich CWC family protein [Paenibacillus lycopersici]|uniref:Cysteine-rich CWC family protein n=2 Tax=Paenibacillus lycopersici TaxID=2704462 RepID=A0A6C0G1D3_9BACL|nr:cysteine-rich CWC family protein [Paenibacillus lycopersici]